MEDPIKEVYEKYKHLAPLLTDENPCSFGFKIAHDLWMAIKAALEEVK
jgi:hypothetical protein